MHPAVLIVAGGAWPIHSAVSSGICQHRVREPNGQAATPAQMVWTSHWHQLLVTTVAIFAERPHETHIPGAVA
jgi:hypothetical protein